MADDRDDSQRTEDPTQKRLQDAREKGEFPRSQDVVTFATLSAATFAIVVWGGEAGQIFIERFGGFLSHPEDFDASAGGILGLAWAVAAALAAILAVPFVAMLDAAKTLDFMRSPPGNRLEALKGDRAGQWSVRINDRCKVCSVWADAGPDEVEIVDHH